MWIPINIDGSYIMDLGRTDAQVELSLQIIRIL